MISSVKNYSCPFCIQKSSRRFNLEVHIKRRHSGVDLALNNPHEATNVRRFGYRNYNLKPSYSPSNVVFYDDESVWGQTNRDNRQEDFMDRMINLLSKQVQLKDLVSQLMPPHPLGPYSQQFYYPSTLGQFIQKSPNFSTLPFHQSSLANPAGSINISDPVSNKGDENLSKAEVSTKLKPFQLISLRGSICDKCLTVDTIPTFLYKDGTVNEVYNHSCSEDRVLDLGRRDKRDLNRFLVVLHRILPKILAEFIIYNKSQAKIYLIFMKCYGFASSNTEDYNIGGLNCPIRFLDVFTSKHQWINQIRNSQKLEGTVQLKTKEELLSFLEISIDSTMMMLKVKRDSSPSPSSENWDSYLVALNLPEHNLEKVNKPFTLKIPKLKCL